MRLRRTLRHTGRRIDTLCTPLRMLVTIVQLRSSLSIRKENMALVNLVRNVLRMVLLILLFLGLLVFLVRSSRTLLVLLVHPRLPLALQLFLGRQLKSRRSSCMVVLIAWLSISFLLILFRPLLLLVLRLLLLVLLVRRPFEIV